MAIFLSSSSCFAFSGLSIISSLSDGSTLEGVDISVQINHKSVQKNISNQLFPKPVAVVAMMFVVVGVVVVVVIAIVVVVARH